MAEFRITEGLPFSFRVRRTNGTVGAVAVDWFIDSDDFAPNSGTLTWANGEDGFKRVEVQALATDGPFSTMVYLSNPRRTDGGPGSPGLVQGGGSAPVEARHRTVFNGTKAPTIGAIPKLEVLWPMGDMFPGTAAQKQFGDGLDEAFFKAFMSDMTRFPPGVNVCFDFEGALTATGIARGLAYWHWAGTSWLARQNPAIELPPPDSRESATDYRLQAAIWCKEVRPDLRIGMYDIPGRPGLGHLPEQLPEREQMYTQITDICDDGYIICYWRGNQTQAQWEDMVEITLGHGRDYHNMPYPRALVTDIVSSKTCTPAEFAHVIRYLRARGLQTVYWTGASTTDESQIRPEIRHILDNPNDQVPGTLNIINAGNPINEEATFTLVVERDGASEGAASVDWTLTGVGGAPSSGTLTWADGETGPKSAQILLDAVDEDTQATINLSNPGRPDSGTPDPFIGTGELEFTVVDTTTAQEPGVFNLVTTAIDIDEGTTAEIQVSRSGGTDGAVAISIAVYGAFDKEPWLQDLNWADGVGGTLSAFVAVGLVESTTAGSVLIGNPRRTDGGNPAPTLGTTTGTLTVNPASIPADEPGQFNFVLASSSTPEATTDHQISVSRTGGSDGAVRVGYAITSDPNGVDPEPFLGFLNWANGDSSNKSFPIDTGEVIADSPVTYTLFDPTRTDGGDVLPTIGSQATHVVTIENTLWPGQIDLLTTEANLQTGGELQIFASRTEGSQYAVAVDWAITGADATPSSGTLNWTDGDIFSKSATVTFDAVTDETIATITLSNVRRVGGGSGDPTLGEDVGTVTIAAPVTPGVLAIDAASFTETEGDTFTIPVNRADGTAGAVGVSYSVGPAAFRNFVTSPTFGNLSWPDGDDDPRIITLNTSIGLPENISGTVSIGLPTGNPAPTLGSPSVSTLFLNQIPPPGDEYTLATIGQRWTIPFSYNLPALPDITNEVTVYPDNHPTVALRISNNKVPGRRIILSPGSYGNQTFNTQDQEIVLQAGASIGVLTVGSAARRLLFRGETPRVGTIGYLRIGVLGQDYPQDITFNGITQYHVEQTPQADYPNLDNEFWCIRLAILNSSFMARGYAFLSFSAHSPGNPARRLTDCILANNIFRNDTTLQDAPLLNPRALSRQQGALRLVQVDNLFAIGHPDRHSVRHHANHGGEDTDLIYVAGNQIEGSGNSFVRSAIGPSGVGTFGQNHNLWFEYNRQYTVPGHPLSLPINVTEGSGGGPINFWLRNNEGYGTQAWPNVGQQPSGGSWTISGNTQNAYQAPPAWTFDTWKD